MSRSSVVQGLAAPYHAKSISITSGRAHGSESRAVQTASGERYADNITTVEMVLWGAGGAVVSGGYISLSPAQARELADVLLSTADEAEMEAILDREGHGAECVYRCITPDCHGDHWCAICAAAEDEAVAE